MPRRAAPTAQYQGCQEGWCMHVVTSLYWECTPQNPVLALVPTFLCKTFFLSLLSIQKQMPLAGDGNHSSPRVLCWVSNSSSHRASLLLSLCPEKNSVLTCGTLAVARGILLWTVCLWANFSICDSVAHSKGSRFAFYQHVWMFNIKKWQGKVFLKAIFTKELLASGGKKKKKKEAQVVTWILCGAWLWGYLVTLYPTLYNSKEHQSHWTTSS